MKLQNGRTRRTRRSNSVTLAQVSRDAGVSIMTVSNVVRGRTELVKLETRRRVEESIARLNYRPNLSARNLRLAENRSVGIVIADTDPAFLSDPFISRLVSGLSNYLSGVDYTLDVQGVSPERFESATILTKAGNDALCAILCGSKELRKSHFEYLQKLGQPVVVFQEMFQPHSDNIVMVHQDDFAGGAALGRLLLERNVRSILFVRPMLEWCAVEQRERGLRSALRHTKHIDVKAVLAPSEGFDDVERITREHLSRRVPDAIVAATDSLAGAVLSACEAHGLRVPADVAVTGFNGFDVWRYTRPSLTTVMSPAYEMGRHAGEILVQRLGGKKVVRLNSIFPVGLHKGDSA
ncbi:MAG TPA: LacI family DNA-binding transcriptional regulator [Steroidobacteraceae bacterium]